MAGVPKNTQKKLQACGWGNDAKSDGIASQGNTGAVNQGTAGGILSNRKKGEKKKKKARVSNLEKAARRGGTAPQPNHIRRLHNLEGPLPRQFGRGKK